MYVLNQSAIIAYNKIIYHTEPHGYHPVTFTTELWEHMTKKTKFCLCVDGFCQYSIVDLHIALVVRVFRFFQALLTYINSSI